MSQTFPRWADTVVRLVMLAVVVVPVALVALGYVVSGSDYVTGANRIVPQPVPFSHKHHTVDLGIDCRYCHTSVEAAAYAGMPPTHTCMSCHSQVWTNADMLAPVRQSLASDTPLRWMRVNDLPDYVYFDHHAHVRNGIGCTTCHGQVGEMPLMAQAAPLSMGWCLSCHRNPAPNLRPEAEIFAPVWAPPPDQEERGKALLAHYGINIAGLTECSTCHR